MRLGKVGVIVAARMLSSRLPGKALLPLNGVPMIAFLLRRLLPVRQARVVLATTLLSEDDQLAALAEAEGADVFRGADSDVVMRYVTAAADFGFDTVVRVTADCPFVSAELVNWCLVRISEFGACDLATTKGRFPVGLDVEIYSTELMARLHAEDKLTLAEREHLTLYFYHHRPPCVVKLIDPRPEWRIEGCRFTVDTLEDYEAAHRLAKRLGRIDASLQDVIIQAAA